MLALATLTIYPVIVFLLPWLQKKANAANASRVDLSRTLSSHIAESVTGIQEVQVHGAYRRENRKFGQVADLLQTVRVRWSFLKFGIKTANNFFVSLGPFVVFLFGGYLIMQGELELGAMVAFLSAQEKLYDPWKELIDYYQVYQDARVRYYRTMEQFAAMPDFDPELVGEKTHTLEGRIEVKDLVFTTGEGVRLLKGVSLTLEPGMHLAVVGFSGSGKSTLVQCIARMHRYSGGTVVIDGHDLEQLTKKDIVSNIGYISQSPFVVTGTIRENLLYAEQAMHELGSREETETAYAEPQLDRLIYALQQAGLFVDVMRFGLESTLQREDSGLTAKIVRIRANFRKNFGKRLASYVEFYQRDRFLYHALISGYLNLGLLDPLEVCRRVEAEWRAGRAPLNAAEGFVRQIIGWREYVRGIYFLEGPDYAARNALGDDRKLPPLYWGAATRMACLSQVVEQTRDEAYAHHIQRLMVTGNFALLAGVDPAEVHEWYL